MGRHHSGLKSFVSKTRYTGRISCEMTCAHHLMACYCKASVIDPHRIMAIRGRYQDIVIAMPRSKILLLDRVISYLFRIWNIFTLVGFNRMDEKAKGWVPSSHIGNFLLRAGEGCVHSYEVCRSDKRSGKIIEGGV
jgi:hypothetical protein